MTRIAERAEAADHHPDLDIRYRKVRVALSTHDAGGLTDKDFDLAAEIEACAHVIIAIVGTIILVLMIAVVVAIARDRGPGPGDVAVAYELAWDRLDFESLFTLSGDGAARRARPPGLRRREAIGVRPTARARVAWPSASASTRW